MPNIGPVELIIILVIALLILGPGKLPDVGSALGKSIREFRKAATDVQDSVNLDATPATPGPTTPGSGAPPLVTAPLAAAVPRVPDPAVPVVNTLSAPAEPNVLTAPDPAASPVIEAAEPVAASPVTTS